MPAPIPAFTPVDNEVGGCELGVTQASSETMEGPLSLVVGEGVENDVVYSKVAEEIAKEVDVGGEGVAKEGGGAEAAEAVETVEGGTTKGTIAVEVEVVEGENVITFEEIDVVEEVVCDVSVLVVGCIAVGDEVLVELVLVESEMVVVIDVFTFPPLANSK